MIYEVNMYHIFNEGTSALSYHESWTMKDRAFNIYEKPILNTVFEIGADPLYMVLIEGKDVSLEEKHSAFKKGRLLILEHLAKKETPPFIVFNEV